jgi:hypothetical protein
VLHFVAFPPFAHSAALTHLRVLTHLPKSKRVVLRLVP